MAGDDHAHAGAHVCVCFEDGDRMRLQALLDEEEEEEEESFGHDS